MIDPYCAALGGALKVLRFRHGISQERAAHLAGLDRSHYCQTERGCHAPNMLTLARLLVVYQTGFEEFGRLVDRELNGKGK